jgi:Domain of unknown function (DUF4136)
MNAMRIGLAALLLTTGLALQGCATKPNVRAEYDHAADFGKYRTFNFVPQLSTDKKGYSTLTTEQLKSAVTHELQQRGYQVSTEPDLLVNFSGRLEDKQSIESSPTGYYGYRTGYYGAWPGYAMGSDVYTVNYKQGTLNVDIVDAKTMRMVWEGVTVGEVTKKHLKDREATINKAVSNIFAKYPFQAGASQPVETAASK